jgi:glycosyltransferase involved in cell wall biosynthesis
MERVDLAGYELVVSSSSAWAHGVNVDEGAVHVCYCHNPFRYAWSAREATLARFGRAPRAALSVVFDRWQAWDRRVARRVDAYVANSRTTQERIKGYWDRDSRVVYPPVLTGRFDQAAVGGGEHYLVLSELVPHKRIDVAVEAFNRLGRPLTVVGDGPDSTRLRRLAGPSVTFAGRVTDDRVAELLASCRALVVTATEEFGIAAVEAQASGRPVIALAEGGVCETVEAGRTGVFFARSDPAALAAAVEELDGIAIDPGACRESAERFDVAHFEAGLRAAVADAWAAPRS